MIDSRSFISISAASVFACVAAHAPAAAQSWPSRPMTMVVPFAAGGGADIMGRIVAARLSEILGQQVIVENAGGAGGMTGSYRVATRRTSRSTRARSIMPRPISRRSR
jgi:tripartite-type tricarboxylate transporter receptor subunit TctC